MEVEETAAAAAAAAVEGEEESKAESEAESEAPDGDELVEACDALYNKIVAFVQASNEANALRDENDKLKGDNAILRTKLDKARAVSDKMISQAASKEDEIRKLRQDLQEVQEKHDELVNDIAQVKRVLNKNNRKTIVTPQQARAASVQKGSSN